MAPLSSLQAPEKADDAGSQGKALAEEMSRAHREAQAAAEQLGRLLDERDADRRQLAMTQQALQDAMQHLEEISDEAEVLQLHSCQTA